jgi:dihydrolipoamide dehydrogenase
MDVFDVVVLGSGPGSEPVWSAAGGRSVAVVERALVGGACPLVACVPSKSMLRSAGAWAMAAEPEFAPFYRGATDPALAWRHAVHRRKRAVHNGDDWAFAERLRHIGATLVPRARSDRSARVARRRRGPDRLSRATAPCSLLSPDYYPPIAATD